MGNLWVWVVCEERFMLHMAFHAMPYLVTRSGITNSAEGSCTNHNVLIPVVFFFLVRWFQHHSRAIFTAEDSISIPPLQSVINSTSKPQKSRRDIVGYSALIICSPSHASPASSLTHPLTAPGSTQTICFQPDLGSKSPMLSAPCCQGFQTVQSVRPSRVMLNLGLLDSRTVTGEAGSREE